MAQTINLRFRENVQSSILNQKFELLLGNRIIRGFLATPSGMNIGLNVDSEAGDSVLIYKGVAIHESGNVPSAVTVPAANPTHARIDVLYVTYVHEVSNSVATYGIVSGVPAASPVKPALPADSFEIATILVPAGASSIAINNITQEIKGIGGITDPVKILAALLEVDENNSGLNATYLQGNAPGAFANATHTHGITDVTNLQNTLNGKALSTHSHTIENITNLQTALDGKAGSSHTHTIANVSNLQSALDSKLNKLAAKTAGEFYTGTTMPTNTNRLNYDGYLYATKLFNPTYKDYAEFCPREEPTERGDIIEFNPKTGLYRKSRKKKTRFVRGVHSEDYGHILGGDSGKNVEERHIPVGMLGRLPVKIKGKARAGQFVVASNIPGVGIAINRYIPGATIGQLECDKTTSGVGLVMMFIRY